MAVERELGSWPEPGTGDRVSHCLLLVLGLCSVGHCKFMLSYLSHLSSSLLPFYIQLTVSNSYLTASHFTFISSPTPTTTEHRKADLYHTLRWDDLQFTSTGVCVLRGLYVRALDLADVAGQGPDSMLMVSSTSFLCSQWEPPSLDSGWSKGFLGSERAFSYVITEPYSFCHGTLVGSRRDYWIAGLTVETLTLQ